MIKQLPIDDASYDGGGIITGKLGCNILGTKQNLDC
jgi:hypothetical protein